MIATPRWLDAEYRQGARDATHDTVRLLRGMGVPADVLYGLTTDYPMYGVARIETFASGFYEPSENGQMAIIQPIARCLEPGSPDVIDLVAWRANMPSTWWLRRGLWPILNPDAVDEASFFDAPLTVLSTPLDFLRAGCRGCVVLRWEGCIAFHLGTVKRVMAAGHQTAARLGQAYSADTPQIRCMELLHAA